MQYKSSVSFTSLAFHFPGPPIPPNTLKSCPQSLFAYIHPCNQHRKATEEENEKKSGGKKVAKEAKVGRASSLDDKSAAGIRAVFGLGAKPATTSGIEVLSSDSDLEEASAGVASSSGSSKNLHTSPTQSAQTNPQIGSK